MGRLEFGVDTLCVNVNVSVLASTFLRTFLFECGGQVMRKTLCQVGAHAASLFVGALKQTRRQCLFCKRLNGIGCGFIRQSTFARQKVQRLPIHAKDGAPKIALEQRLSPCSLDLCPLRGWELYKHTRTIPDRDLESSGSGLAVLAPKLLGAGLECEHVTIG
jgi:hypothetical protein